jgi:hypothetical protein
MWVSTRDCFEITLHSRVFAHFGIEAAGVFG